MRMHAWQKRQEGLAVFSKLLREWPTNHPTWIKCVKLRQLGNPSKPVLKFRCSGASKNRKVLPLVARLVRVRRQKLIVAAVRGTQLMSAGRAFLKAQRLLV